jgi:uncharacterized protein (DUF1697 family)
VLARELAAYDVVNVGAAGTLVVWRPGRRVQFLSELRRKLPFQTDIASCDARDLIRLEANDPFGSQPAAPDTVRFMSVLLKPASNIVSLPIAIPHGDDWFVRIVGANKQLIFGEYRRHMKAIGYLGQIDRIFGAPATTRSWSTIRSVLQVLKASSGAKR